MTATEALSPSTLALPSRAGLPAPRRVLIVGGGFGGLAVARALADAPVEITLIDRRNHHLFQPLLYQVASAALSPGEIAEPIRSLLSTQKNVRVMLGEVVNIDTAARTVGLADRTVPYDRLILAAGATHSYFGHDDWAAHAPGLKTMTDALEIRQRVLMAYERAELATDPNQRRRCLTFVVVGGGPTGVELAGALCEIARKTLVQDFRNIDPSLARVVLIEGGDAVLAPFPSELRIRALRQLQKLGVEVLFGRPVSRIDADGVVVGDERILSDTVLWAAGVAGAKLGAKLGVPLDRMGRVIVLADNTVPGHPDIAVIGDLACFQHTPDGKPLPGVAQVAMQGGARVAENLLAEIAGKPLRPFVYKDLGSMATVGRSMAVAWLGRFQFSGLFAWLLWLFVHLISLVGFRSRLEVLFQWAWSYTTWERNARLIHESDLHIGPALSSGVASAPSAALPLNGGVGLDREARPQPEQAKQLDEHHQRPHDE